MLLEIKSYHLFACVLELGQIPSLWYCSCSAQSEAVQSVPRWQNDQAPQIDLQNADIHTFLEILQTFLVSLKSEEKCTRKFHLPFSSASISSLFFIFFFLFFSPPYSPSSSSSFLLILLLLLVPLLLLRLLLLLLFHIFLSFFYILFCFSSSFLSVI